MQSHRGHGLLQRNANPPPCFIFFVKISESYQMESDTVGWAVYIGEVGPRRSMSRIALLSGASAEISRGPPWGDWFFVPLRVFASPAFACRNHGPVPRRMCLR